MAASSSGISGSTCIRTDGTANDSQLKPGPVIKVEQVALRVTSSNAQDKDHHLLRVTPPSTSTHSCSEISLSDSDYETAHIYKGVPFTPSMLKLLQEYLGNFGDALIERIGEKSVEDWPEIKIDRDQPFDTLGDLVQPLTFYTPMVIPYRDCAGSRELMTQFQRFNDIRCPMPTAVKTPKGYLHANRVSMPDGFTYICAQAPLPAYHEHFWLTAIDKAPLIVDLTRAATDDKPAKVEPYYPSTDKPEMTVGYVKLSCTGQVAADSETEPKQCQVFTYNGQGPADPTPRPVWRMHYGSWPDFGTIPCEVMHSITSELTHWRQKSGAKEVIVHCRAGVGRTGTLVVAMALRHLWEQKKLSDDNWPETVLALVLAGRMQRGDSFVQSRSQMASLYHYAKFLCSTHEKQR